LSLDDGSRMVEKKKGRAAKKVTRSTERGPLGGAPTEDLHRGNLIAGERQKRDFWCSSGEIGRNSKRFHPRERSSAKRVWETQGVGKKHCPMRGGKEQVGGERIQMKSGGEVEKEVASLVDHLYT